MTSLRHLEGWKLASACSTHPDPDLWFADDGPAVTAAKAVCAGCPVRPTCLREALTRGEGVGVWGGLDPAERRHVAAGLGLRRPSIHAAAQHGTRGRYVAGCRCAPCTAANARYVAAWRHSRSGVTTRLTVVTYVLTTPAGRGRHRAFPGQLAIQIGAVA